MIDLLLCSHKMTQIIKKKIEIFELILIFSRLLLQVLEIDVDVPTEVVKAVMLAITLFLSHLISLFEKRKERNYNALLEGG